ncbi:MAG TPA: Mrp/NBP35 family ATP-binding protein [Chloroflexota bacterium]|nr:Mrp/NBP35 family ATP-binding protein [Chloroflexota bacterium]
MLFKKERTAPVTKDAVLDALRQIIDPDLHRDIVSLGMIKDLQIRPDDEGSQVSFTFELTTPACPVRDRFKSQAEEVVSAVEGVSSVEVTMSANVRQNAPGGNRPSIDLPNVKNIIAVGSGKGGVGKSTVAANLAVALARTGARVGLLDADVYGPSVPALMGVREPIRAEERALIPNEAHGVKLMSLGFMTEGDRPVIWRGPMVGQAVKQMLGEARWGDLDYLLVDLPPGTGDAPLTLIQSIPLAGVVIVTTPQDVALGIATKALAMFRNLHVPILGIIENMSFFQCPDCGHQSHIFSHGGGRDAAASYNVPFLGEVPLDEGIRISGDQGLPVPAQDPGGDRARLFEDLARRLAAQISIRNSRTIPLAVR